MNDWPSAYVRPELSIVTFHKWLKRTLLVSSKEINFIILKQSDVKNDGFKAISATSFKFRLHWTVFFKPLPTTKFSVQFFEERNTEIVASTSYKTGDANKKKRVLLRCVLSSVTDNSWSRHGDENVDAGLLCNVVWTCRYITTTRNNILPPSSGTKHWYLHKSQLTVWAIFHRHNVLEEHPIPVFRWLVVITQTDILIIFIVR